MFIQLEMLNSVSLMSINDCRYVKKINHFKTVKIKITINIEYIPGELLSGICDWINSRRTIEWNL